MDDLGEQLEQARVSVGSESIAHKESDWCTLIEVGSGAGERWVQLHAGMLNMQYVHAGDPVQVVGEAIGGVPVGASPVDHEEKLYATFDVHAVGDPEIEDFVRRVLNRYYGFAGELELRVSTENLG